MATTFRNTVPSREAMYTGLTDCSSLSLKAGLYTAAPDLEEDISEMSALECAGPGYTAGGIALTGVGLQLVNHYSEITADDITWVSLGPLTPTPTHCVFYDSVTDRIFGYIILEFEPNLIDYILEFTTGIMLRGT